MKIKFESNLAYQQAAISAVTDIFKGQQICRSNFTVYAPAKNAAPNLPEFNVHDLGYANKLNLGQVQVLENMQQVQLHNNRRASVLKELSLAPIDASVEMETGTGKTYVYLRSIMEMNRLYGFTKFIIVVPSIPIKEGVKATLLATESHFKEHFNNINYSHFVYDSSRLSQIREFATGTGLQIMVINIQAFARDSDTSKDSKTGRILLDYNDQLGFKPLHLIQETRAIVIVDEPQTTLSTKLQKDSVNNLKPLAMFRYSATHREPKNLLYRLDAVAAYEQQLVKQIEVASVRVEGAASNGPYIKLIAVQNKKGITATLEMDVFAKGKTTRQVKKNISRHHDLQQISGMLPQYEGYMVQDIYTAADNEYIHFSNDVVVRLNESIGAVEDAQIKRLMIRKTIDEHLDKELRLNPKGIKVLSLFFIDKVSRYRIYDEDGNPSPGEYARIFEEEYAKAIKLPKYSSLFHKILDRETPVAQVHNGYFAMDKKAKTGSGEGTYKDSNGSTIADESAYELIMKKKEELLSFESKLRFLFSHSALKEGWDNPNVFQICTLKEAGGSEIRRRQEIGRGLRLAVNQQGERVYGFEVNTLTVVASESYDEFVRNLQEEMELETGIKFGELQPHSFNNITVSMNGNEPEYLGHERSAILFNALVNAGYLSLQGKVQDTLKEDLLKGKVQLPEWVTGAFSPQVLEVLRKTAGRLDIKRNEQKVTVKVNKQVLFQPEFTELWNRIKHKTTYSVNYSSEALITKCAETIQRDLRVNGGKLVYEKSLVDLTLGGYIANEPEIQYGLIKTEVEILPDIVSYLQNETQLTRKTIVAILQRTGKVIEYYKMNPQKFIEGAVDIIKAQMRLSIVDGIKYTRLGDTAFYDQKLFENEELTGYFTGKLEASTKSPYEHVLYDSGVESKMAKDFENFPDVKVYAKLPSWFTIGTPLGTYNPDWAVVLDNDGTDALYFVVESKGTDMFNELRESEQNKIICGSKHFAAIAPAGQKAVPLLVSSTAGGAIIKAMEVNEINRH